MSISSIHYLKVSRPCHTTNADDALFTINRKRSTFTPKKFIRMFYYLFAYLFVWSIFFLSLYFFVVKILQSGYLWRLMMRWNELSKFYCHWMTRISMYLFNGFCYSEVINMKFRMYFLLQFSFESWIIMIYRSS